MKQHSRVSSSWAAVPEPEPSYVIPQMKLFFSTFPNSRLIFDFYFIS